MCISMMWHVLQDEVVVLCKMMHMQTLAAGINAVLTDERLPYLLCAL